MSQTFDFKPAPLARPIRVEVEDDGAVLRSAKGAVKSRVDFSAAQRLRFTEMHGRGVASRWFDVEHAAGRFRVHCNSGSLDDPTKGHLAQYRAAVRAILLGIESRTPGLEVDLEAGRGTRIAMFVMGAVTALFGLLLPIVALATGVDRSKILGGLVPTLLMLFIGVWLMSQFKPWVRGARVPAALLAESLAADPV